MSRDERRRQRAANSGLTIEELQKETDEGPPHRKRTWLTILSPEVRRS